MRVKDVAWRPTMPPMDNNINPQGNDALYDNPITKAEKAPNTAALEAPEKLTPGGFTMNVLNGISIAEIGRAHV